MDTIATQFKNITKISLLILLSLSLSCSDDPSSPKKEDEDPIPQDVGTIGVEGGTIEKDDITITIPAGAFNENYDISVITTEDDGAFGENIFTETYKIKGLPTSSNQPIKIKLKYSGELINDAFLAVGEAYYDSLSENYLPIYTMINATDSADFLLANYYGNDSSKLNIAKHTNIKFIDPFEIIMEGVTARQFIETTNYTLNYPIEHEQYLDRIIEVIEGPLRILEEIGIPKTYFPDRYFACVNIQNGLIRFKHREHNNTAIFNLSWESISNQKFSELKISLGRLLLNINATEYFRELNGYNKSSSLFINALEVWSESKFTEDPNYVGPVSRAYSSESIISPFYGIRKGGVPNSRPYAYLHGNGLGTLIHYLVNKETIFGIEGIAKTFDNSEFVADVISAMIGTVDEQISVWLPDYFKELVNGDIFNIPTDYFIKNAHYQWNVDDINDTLKVFDSNNIGLLPDLSAKIFKINLGYADVDETQNMLLSVNGPLDQNGLSLVVFGIQDDNAIYLGTAFDQDFEIPDLNAYYHSGISGMRQFLVVLVNSLGTPPYLGESDIDFEIKINPKQEVGFNYNRCNVKFNSMANIHSEYQHNGTSSDDIRNFLIFSKKVTGSFTGNTFMGSYEDGGLTETVSVTMSNDFKNVTSVVFSGEFSDDNSLVQRSFTAVNIPQFADRNRFKLQTSTGTEVFNAISDFNYFNQAFTTVTTLTNYTCDASSYIEILFETE